MLEETRDQLSRLTRERRAELGVSLARVAEASGDPTLHSSWITRLEQGKIREIPSRERLEALARGLRLPPQQVARAAGQQFLGISEEYSTDGDARAIVDYLETFSEEDRRALRAMVEAFARSRRSGEDDGQ
ncbi:helix-turn-helix domain-containing protein [Streptomyces desertarenae]|uniref:Helix-turn-helix domain-containing protein n=1 Tax=Streptomyces desertarenae TaxID=2666184 RepID=A0ABW4PQF6_9ACTN